MYLSVTAGKINKLKLKLKHANTDANGNYFDDQIKPRICLTISNYGMTHIQGIWTNTPEDEHFVGVLFLLHP